MKDKQKKIIAIAGVVLLVAGLIFAFSRAGQKGGGQGEVSLTPTPTMSKFEGLDEPELALELSTSRIEGKLTVSNIDSQFTGLEYEVIYQYDYEGTPIERGISSGGAITVPSSRRIVKDLFFGTQSCTSGKCHIRAEEVEIDQSVSLIIRLLNERNEIWELAKTVTFVKEGSVYQANIEDAELGW